MGARQPVIRLLAGMLTVAAFLGGCADPARNLYEGVKARNESQRTPIERATKPVPDYDEYRKERDR